MNNPCFSVIISNYNYARFLPQAINSVLTQSFDDYELIVVDDCSTDHSRDVILSYGDKIKPVFLDKNGGQGAAFNAGVAASTGRLISFLDADDVFHRDKLLRVYQTASKKPNAIMIYHQCYNTNVMGEIISGIHPTRMLEGNLSGRIYQYGEAITPQTSLLTFRSDFIQKIFPICPYFNRQAGDASIMFLACLAGEIACIREVLAYYRLHGNNVFSSSNLNKVETIRRFMRRNEKEYYYMNSVLPRLGINKPIDIMKYRFHLGNLLIFDQISKWKFLARILPNPNFNSWKDKTGYIKYIFRKRQEYLRSRICQANPYSA